MKALTLILLLSAVLFVPAHKLVAGNNFSINSLMELLASKDKSSGTFVEYRYSSLLKKPVRITGKLLYEKPDLLIKENLSPVAETMKIKGDSIEYAGLENGKKITRTLAVDDYPFLKTMAVGLRAAFAGDLEGLRKFYKIKLSGDKSDWKLVLTTNAVVTDPDELFDNIIRKMIISGSGTDFRKIEMFDTEGDRTIINISPS